MVPCTSTKWHLNQENFATDLLQQQEVLDEDLMVPEIDLHLRLINQGGVSEQCLPANHDCTAQIPPAWCHFTGDQMRAKLPTKIQKPHALQQDVTMCTTNIHMKGILSDAAAILTNDAHQQLEFVLHPSRSGVCSVALMSIKPPYCRRPILGCQDALTALTCLSRWLVELHLGVTLPGCKDFISLVLQCMPLYVLFREILSHINNRYFTHST